MESLDGSIPTCSPRGWILSYSWLPAQEAKAQELNVQFNIEAWRLPALVTVTMVRNPHSHKKSVHWGCNLISRLIWGRIDLFQSSVVVDIIQLLAACWPGAFLLACSQGPASFPSCLWVQTALRALPCGPPTSLHQSQRGREPSTEADVTVLCKIWMWHPITFATFH